MAARRIDSSNRERATAAWTRLASDAHTPAFAFVLAFVFLVLPASAAVAAGIRAAVDRTEITAEEQIVMQVTIEGSRSAEPTFADLSASFDVQAAGQSTQVQVTNGRMSSSVIYNYVLTPKQPGTFTIAPVTADIDGTVYRSSAFTVRVLAARDVPRRERVFFTTASVSQSQAYVGEQLEYTWRYYSRGRVTEAQLTAMEFPGFLVVDLGKEKQFETTVEGQQYMVTEIRRALFPQEAGNRIIPAAALTIQAVAERRRGRRGFFDSPMDDFFGGAQTVTKVLKTDPVSVRVVALPPAPAGFSGIVGEATLAASVSKSALRVGESATLAVTVSSPAHPSVLTEPPLSGLDGFKSYDDKPAVSSSETPLGLVTTKIFHKALVPTRAGRLDISALSLTYFDPKSATFRSVVAAPLAVTVEPGTVPEDLRLTEAAAPVGGKSAVRVLADDIVPIYKKMDAVHDGAAWSHRGAVLLILGLTPAAIYFVLWWLSRQRAQTRQSAQERRRRRALGRALKQASASQHKLDSGHQSQAAAILSRALRDYLGDKLGVEGGALTAGEARQLLEQAGATGDLIAEVQSVLGACEAAQYGAPSGADGQLVPLSSRLVGLLKRLDRDLRAA